MYELRAMGVRMILSVDTMGMHYSYHLIPDSTFDCTKTPRFLDLR